MGRPVAPKHRPRRRKATVIVSKYGVNRGSGIAGALRKRDCKQSVNERGAAIRRFSRKRR
jgi:hypothetical protein